ncbi:MAG: M56 family metallopeptidase [Phycisphaerales bacterium]|nr:M56 family metallopeptidase [Phycisphaerales bacterium]
MTAFALHVVVVAAVVVVMLMDAGVKSTALLGVAWGVTLMLRKRSAAVRHLVWVATLASLMLLPMLSLMLPAWHVLPSWATMLRVVVVEKHSLVPGSAGGSGEAVGSSLRVDAGTELRNLRQSRGLTANPKQTAMVIAPYREEIVVKNVSAKDGNNWIWLLGMAVIWGGGVLVAMLPVMVGAYSAARRRRESMAMTGAFWERQVGMLKNLLGIRRAVLVRKSAACSVPLTFGILRPTILLSDAAEMWLEEKRRIVLLHELAHIKRLDCVTIVLAHVVRSFYWFQPLAWLAVLRARAECERACDDVVLRAGAKSSEYAETLLEYANVSDVSVGSLAMARASTLERRLRAILNPAMRRSALTRKALVIVAGLAIVAVSLLAILCCTESEQGKAQGVQSPGLGGAASRARSAADFPTAVGDTVANALEHAKISFLSPARIAEIRAEFHAIVQAHMDPSRLPDQQRQQAILDSLYKRIDGLNKYANDHVTEILYNLRDKRIGDRVDGFLRPPDNYLLDNLYLGMPDRLKTLQLLVVEALEAPTLNEADLRRLNEQREFMRGVIRSAAVPANSPITHTLVLGEFESLCGDPLAILLQKPMTNVQFSEFKKNLASPQDTQAILRDIAWAVVRAQYYPLDAEHHFHMVSPELPFKDSVFTLMTDLAGQLDLRFASNRAFVGFTNHLPDISRNVAYDLRWQSFRLDCTDMHDDFHLDLAKQQLVGAAETKFIPLDVHRWLDADGISSETLLKNLAAKGLETFDLSGVASRGKRTTVPQGKVIGGYPTDVFFAVTNSRHDLVVIQIQSLEGGEVLLHARSRAISAPATQPTTAPIENQKSKIENINQSFITAKNGEIFGVGGDQRIHARGILTCTPASGNSVTFKFSNNDSSVDPAWPKDAMLTATSAVEIAAQRDRLRIQVGDKTYLADKLEPLAPLPAASQPATRPATAPAAQALIDRFFQDNYDIIAERKTLAIGDPRKNPDGTATIRYDFQATLWNSDIHTLQWNMTFDAAGLIKSIQPLPQSLPKNAPATSSRSFPCPQRFASYDRELAQAMTYDSEINTGLRLPGGQALAEKHYLAALDKTQDLAIRACILTQLGVLFATNYHSDYGESADFDKSTRYHQQALKEAGNRIGYSSIRARSQLLTPKQTMAENLAIRLADYRWLLSLDEKTVRANYLPSRFKPANTPQNDDSIRALMGHITGLAEVQADNILSILKSRKELAPQLPVILRDFPDTPLAKEVQKLLDKP